MLQLFETQIGRICVSILWGLALSLFFKKTCVGNKCIVITGPPVQEVINNIYAFEGEGKRKHCYKFMPLLKTCDGAEKRVFCV